MEMLEREARPEVRRGPYKFRGVRVPPEIRRLNWNQAEAYWWRVGVMDAQEAAVKRINDLFEQLSGSAL